jgi:hypothetical protein
MKIFSFTIHQSNEKVHLPEYFIVSSHELPCCYYSTETSNLTRFIDFIIVSFVITTSYDRIPIKAIPR